METIKSWDDFNIKTDLLRGVYSYGFEFPSDIQKTSIPHIISGKDIIAQAHSGSGKTGAFSISVLQSIEISNKTTQAIIIAPTHELVKQISVVISTLCLFIEGLLIKTLIGGTPIQQDADDIRKSTPHIVIGSPGRILDMINRNYLNVYTVKLFVLDEADEMLSRGFKPQIYNIFQRFNNEVQVALFSASMPPEVIELANKFTRSPVIIDVKKEDINLKCIQQYYVAVQNDHHKYEMLKQLFSIITINQCIIYCNSVKSVIELNEALLTDGFSVCCIHSSMDKGNRDSTLSSFRNGSHRILVSSNITARGIDIQQISTVVNFDVPKMSSCLFT
jgi:translation initiation factor 4A